MFNFKKTIYVPIGEMLGSSHKVHVVDVEHSTQLGIASAQGRHVPLLS
jgi:hypothetical protein